MLSPSITACQTLTVGPHRRLPPAWPRYGVDHLTKTDLSALLPEGTDSVTARVQVSATGINFDRQADDDTGREAVHRCATNAAVNPGPCPDTDA